MEPHKTLTIMTALAALIIGSIGGYFFGYTKGAEAQRGIMEAQIEADRLAAQQEIAEKANPFAESEESPLPGYENPFEETTVNPFQ